MKKNSLFLLGSLAAMLVIFSSCQKEFDSPKNAEDLTGTPLPSPTTYCRIESFWVNRFAFDERFKLVLYDEYENPVAITTPGAGTGHPYVTFKYDSWHRLRQYLGAYLGDSFEFLHLYGFDQHGRIGVDTGYVFGSPIEKPVHYLDRSISTIEYDNQNRIIKTITDYERGGYHFEVNYTYDANGNLLYEPDSGITYDNKVNLYRTNDIWMFLARDYSVNNPFIGDAYNSSGFPTAISSTNPSYDLFLDLNIPLYNSRISYGCRQAFW